jgi:hypothetical protein
LAWKLLEVVESSQKLDVVTTNPSLGNTLGNGVLGAINDLKKFILTGRGAGAGGEINTIHAIHSNEAGQQFKSSYAQLEQQELLGKLPAGTTNQKKK